MKPFVERRSRLIAAMRKRGGGVAIICTALEARRNGTSTYPFRWDSNFYYLSGFPEPEAALAIVVAGERVETVLFCREKNEEAEIWNGRRYGTEAAQKEFGFDRALPITALDEEIPNLLANAPAIYYALGADAGLDEKVRLWLSKVGAKVRSLVGWPTQAFDIAAMLSEMRLVKDRFELATMRRTGEINAAAHVRAMLATRPGLHEYEIEAELLHEYIRCGARSPAYESIVAGGANACVLHYCQNNAVLRDGDLLLIDAGCELGGYASDITRSFPVNGHFTAGQRELYEIVLAAQHAALAAIKPGARLMDLHDVATRVIAAGLIEAGLIAGELDEALSSASYKRFYMHRTGHWLGMDVHDVGSYRQAGEESSGEGTPSRILEPGMVFTIEPGIYVRAAPDVPERFHDIGIRIEDDVVMTESGYEILSAGVPNTADEIEALMRKR
ncbi:MAG: Xaa-Pro aminopeptidase [Burkholderiaceae bacterium]|nr:Xaa-Pro aminopeptidase [Burkholderiaceae bacterium]